MRKALFLIAVLLVGCYTYYHEPEATFSVRANPCALEGANYLKHFDEEPGGSCGAIPDFVVHINYDGTMKETFSPKCSAKTESNCTIAEVNCVYSLDGYDFSVDYTESFASNGLTGHGSEVMYSSYRGTNSCHSVYNTTLTYVK